MLRSSHTHSFHCPNPQCTLAFPSDETICDHLCDSSTDSSRWATLHVDTILQNWNIGECDGKFDNELDGTLHNIVEVLILTMTADNDPSLAPLHEQNEELFLDTWSPPTPSSVPPNPQVPSPASRPSTATDVPSILLKEQHKEDHLFPSMSIPGGRNLLQEIDKTDQFASVRAFEADVHYPFASWTEWQLAQWLSTTSLPQSQFEKFLQLDYVSSLLTIKYLFSCLVAGSGASTIIYIHRWFKKSHQGPSQGPQMTVSRYCHPWLQN